MDGSGKDNEEYTPSSDSDSSSSYDGDDGGNRSPSVEMYPSKSSKNPLKSIVDSKAFKSLKKCDFHGFGDESTFKQKFNQDDPLAVKYVDKILDTPNKKIQWDKVAIKTPPSLKTKKVAFSDFGFVDASGSRIQLSESSDHPQKDEFLKAYNSQVFDAALPPVVDPTLAMHIKLGALTPAQQRVNQRFQTPASSDTHIWQRHQQPTSLVNGKYVRRRFPFAKLVVYPSDPDLEKIPTEKRPNFGKKLAFLRKALLPESNLPKVCISTLANCSLRSHECMRLLELGLKFMALDLKDPEKVFKTWKLLNRILAEAVNLNELKLSACQDYLVAKNAQKPNLRKALETSLIKELSDFPVLASTYSDSAIHLMPVSISTGTDPKIVRMTFSFSAKAKGDPKKKDRKRQRDSATSPKRKRKKNRNKNAPTNVKGPRFCQKCNKHWKKGLKQCPTCSPPSST